MAAAPKPEAPLDLEPTPAPEPARPAASAIPKKIRAERVARQRTHKAVAAGVVWGAMGACLVAIFGGAALFRVDVVRLWPRTAGAYAAVGLSVNPTGLSPENIKAQPGLKNGQAAVLVSGAVRNIETHPHPIAPLRISLVDKGGKTLVSKIALFPAQTLDPGHTKAFDIAFLDPPAASHGVEVVFALDYAAAHAGKAKAEHADDHAAAPKLRGQAAPELPAMPAAKSAEALPSDSPYALPAAATNQGVPTPAHGHDG